MHSESCCTWHVIAGCSRLPDCLSQAKNILKRRAVDIASSSNVNVPNSCQGCYVNTWSSGDCIVENYFGAASRAFESEPRTAAESNLDYLKFKRLVDWMLL